MKCPVEMHTEVVHHGVLRLRKDADWPSLFELVVSCEDSHCVARDHYTCVLTISCSNSTAFFTSPSTTSIPANAHAAMTIALIWCCRRPRPVSFHMFLQCIVMSNAFTISSVRGRRAAEFR